MALDTRTRRAAAYTAFAVGNIPALYMDGGPIDAFDLAVIGWSFYLPAGSLVMFGTVLGSGIAAVEIEEGITVDESGNLAVSGRVYEEATYRYYPLDEVLTDPSWEGATFSDVSTSTPINLNTTFGIPADAKAVKFCIICRDSASWGTSNLFFGLGPSSTYWYHTRVRPPGGDVWTELTAVVNCHIVAGPTVYYHVAASGANTFDVYLRVLGYYV